MFTDVVKGRGKLSRAANIFLNMRRVEAMSAVTPLLCCGTKGWKELYY
jgi:hypothetical protein